MVEGTKSFKDEELKKEGECEGERGVLRTKHLNRTHKIRIKNTHMIYSSLHSMSELRPLLFDLYRFSL